MCGFCHFAKLSFLQLIIFHCVYSCFVPSTFFPGDGAFFFFFCISSLMLQMKLFQEPIIFFIGKDSPWFWDNFIELVSQIVYSGWWFPKWGMRHEILHKADNQSQKSKYVRDGTTIMEIPSASKVLYECYFSSTTTRLAS